ncbi:MAG: ABC transporter permease [Rhizomicrobium sp.]
MRHVFLIARQEFVKYVTRRGFLISILMFPLWIMVVIFVPQLTGGGSSGPAPRNFTVVDRAGGAYRDAVVAALARWNKAHAPVWTYTSAPDYLRSASDAHFAHAVHALFGGEAKDWAGRTRVDTVLLVPADFGRNDRAQIWTRDDSQNGRFRAFLTGALTAQLQIAAIHRLAPQLNDPTILDVSVDLEARNPEHAAPIDSVVATSVPIALAIILFVVSVMNSSVLLQGVVEEKSTRMIEVLLSCATPREITSGKLIGVIAVALTTLVIWALVLFALMALASHDTVTLVFASLKAIAGIDTLPFLLVFFLCGLLIYGSLFLAIGSMASSLADAQSLLGPAMLILMLPNVMIAGVMHDPNGTFATALTWIPIYTPFFMMLRIASHPPVWQLWGAVALALATTVLMVLWTGRVFAKHVLTTERPPALGALLRGLLRRT